MTLIKHEFESIEWTTSGEVLSWWPWEIDCKKELHLSSFEPLEKPISIFWTWKLIEISMKTHWNFLACLYQIAINTSKWSNSHSSKAITKTFSILISLNLHPPWLRIQTMLSPASRFRSSGFWSLEWLNLPEMTRITDKNGENLENGDDNVRNNIRTLGETVWMQFFEWNVKFSRQKSLFNKCEYKTKKIRRCKKCGF